MKKRVIFLSSTPLGEQLLEYLKGLNCEIVLADTKNQRQSIFPDYELGLAFLHTHRIPASEFLFPFRWVNFHPGPLPEFRGRNLAYHAMMEGATEYGATIHYMDETYDTGEIIEVSRFPIEPYYNAGDLVRLSHARLGMLFLKHVPSLLNGKAPSKPQGPGRHFSRTPIDDCLALSHDEIQRIRALTVPPAYFAKVIIGGRTYRIIPDETLLPEEPLT